MTKQKETWYIWQFASPENPSGIYKWSTYTIHHPQSETKNNRIVSIVSYEVIYGKPEGIDNIHSLNDRAKKQRRMKIALARVTSFGIILTRDGF